MSHSRINVAHVLLLLICAVVLPVVQGMVPPLVRLNASEINNNGADLSAKIQVKRPLLTIGEYPQCEWIPVTVCQGLGYNMTAMPNLIGHTNLLDAEIMVNVVALLSFFSSC